MAVAYIVSHKPLLNIRTGISRTEEVWENDCFIAWRLPRARLLCCQIGE